MQRLIAKYGLAAHLAFAAVAPLFLFPFFGQSVIDKVVFWLSLYSLVWMLMEPSVRGGEYLRDARRRVVRSVIRDPLFWALMVLLVLAGVQWVNGGICMAYDAENFEWSIAKPKFPILPGSVEGSGKTAFAGFLLLTVILSACRHALGKSARMVFLFLASLLAGLAAIIAVFATNQGHPLARQFLQCSGLDFSYVGAVFGIYMMAGIVALVFAVERKWIGELALFFVAIGGCAVGLIAFAPAYVILLFLAAVLLISGYSFVFALTVIKSVAELKFFLLLLISLGLGWLLLNGALPGVLNAKLAVIMSRDFFPLGFDETRAALSDISLRVWKEHLWIGSGLGSFPIDVRFFAEPGQWAVIPHGTQAVPNAGWQVLAERGILGAVQLALPFLFLLYAYLRRLIVELKGRYVPHPACLVAPLALIVVVLLACVDCTVLRWDLLMALSAVFALSANSFHKEKR